jgi:hypothetical protein
MKLFLSESFVNNVVSNLSESRTQDLGKLKAKELQKIRLINLDMRAAKEAIVNIMKGESEEKGNIHYDFSIESFMSLDLNTENITVRNKFRFHDYFERFYSSRHRGYDFEGMVAGFIDAEISDRSDTPYDITKNSDGKRYSCKSLASESENMVLKGVGDNLKEFVNGKFDEGVIGEDDVYEILEDKNPLKFMIINDFDYLVEEFLDLTLSGLDYVIVGVPNKESNLIRLYLYGKETIKSFVLYPEQYGKSSFLVESKTSGQKQLRFSTAIFKNADEVGQIMFPKMSDKDYESFLTPNKKGNETINLLDKFGEKYGVKKMGQTLPQDMVKDLANNKNFILDLSKILSIK